MGQRPMSSPSKASRPYTWLHRRGGRTWWPCSSPNRPTSIKETRYGIRMDQKVSIPERVSYFALLCNIQNDPFLFRPFCLLERVDPAASCGSGRSRGNRWHVGQTRSLRFRCFTGTLHTDSYDARWVNRWHLFSLFPLCDGNSVIMSSLTNLT